MPASPEFRDAAGLIGVAEVLQERKAEQVAQTDGHIGVAGKVEVDLEGEGDGAQPGRESRGLFHGGDGLPDGAGLVGDEHLLAQADDEPLHAAADLQPVLPTLVELVGHRLILDDGAGDQLGEQRHVGGKVQDVPLGRHLAPVHVDGVGHGLEGVERDADGQGKAQGGNALIEQAVDVCNGEVGVLEEEQNSQVAHHRQNQHSFCALLLSAAAEKADAQAVAVVEHRGEEHDEDVFRLAPAVEQQAGQQQHDVAAFARAEIV